MGGQQSPAKHHSASGREVGDFMVHWHKTEQRKAAAIVRSWLPQKDGAYTYRPYRDPELRRVIKSAARKCSADAQRIEQILGNLESQAGVLVLAEESFLSDLRRARALRDIRRALEREGWPFFSQDDRHPLSRKTIDGLQSEMSKLQYDDIPYLEGRLKGIREEQRALGITKGCTSTAFRKSLAPKRVANALYHYFAECRLRKLERAAAGPRRSTAMVCSERAFDPGNLSKAERGKLMRLAVDIAKCAAPFLAARLTPLLVRGGVKTGLRR